MIWMNLGVRKLVRLGDKLVDWNEQFRLFLFSRSVEVHDSCPQWSSLVNTINFNTTETGLAQQVCLRSLCPSPVRLSLSRSSSFLAISWFSHNVHIPTQWCQDFIEECNVHYHYFVTVVYCTYYPYDKFFGNWTCNLQAIKSLSKES